jgi:hypothetical protein
LLVGILTSRRATGAAVPTPRLPAIYALPVVVAPPKMVRPPVCVPEPMVDDAVEKRPASVERPLVVSVVSEVEPETFKVEPRVVAPVTAKVLLTVDEAKERKPLCARSTWPATTSTKPFEVRSSLVVEVLSRSCWVAT